MNPIQRGLTPPRRVAAVKFLLAPRNRTVVAQAAPVAERMVGAVPYLAWVDTLVEVLRHLSHSAKCLGVQLKLVDDLLEQGTRESVHRVAVECIWVPPLVLCAPEGALPSSFYIKRFRAALRAAFAAALPALRRASKSSKSTTGVIPSNTTAAA